MKKFCSIMMLTAMLFMSFGPLVAFAQNPGAAGVTDPVAIEASKEQAEKALVEADKKVEEAKDAVQSVSTGEVAAGDFLDQVLVAIKQFGGLPTVGKIALIITLLLSSMKVSFLNELLWSKLGAAKVWAAPLLGLIAGLLDLAGTGSVTVATVFAYISAGAGAIILHELLDSLKALPKLGEFWVKVIDVIQKALKGPATK